MPFKGIKSTTPVFICNAFPTFHLTSKIGSFKVLNKQIGTLTSGVHLKEEENMA